VTGEDSYSDFPPRLGRARLSAPLNHVFVREIRQAQLLRK